MYVYKICTQFQTIIKSMLFNLGTSLTLENKGKNMRFIWCVWDTKHDHINSFYSRIETASNWCPKCDDLSVMRTSRS